MRIEKLYHPATGLYQDIPSDYVPAHLSNGWVRPDVSEPENEPEAEEEEKPRRGRPKGQAK